MRALVLVGLSALLYGGAHLGRLVTQVTFDSWLDILRASMFTIEVRCSSWLGDVG